MQRTHDNEISLILSGPEFFDQLIREIDEAQRYIHFQIYIFEPDKTGDGISNALIRAAQRGVKVFVVLDAFGSDDLPSSRLESWNAAGIAVRIFSPLFGRKGLAIRRRLHHKIITMDGRVAFTGGMNIGDRYKGSAGEIPWLDLMVRVLGSGVAELESVCLFYWDRARRRSMPVPQPVPGKGKAEIRVLRNDRFRGKHEIASAHKELISGSKERILILASYFLPGRSLRNALKKASARGVKITLVLPGKSDVGLASAAMHHLYPFLLKSGIEILEWNRSVFHAKWLSMDGQTILVGSFNLNHLSDFSSIETNIEVTDPLFCREAEEKIRKEVIDQCTRVSREHYLKKTGWWMRMKYQWAYLVIRFLFRLMHRMTSTE